jgi:ketosteroid isomerase-like protein
MQCYNVFTSALGIGLFAIALPAAAASVDPSTCEAKAWQDAFNKGDVATIVGLYTPDAIEVLPGGIRTGTAAVQQRIEQDLKQGGKHLVVGTTKCNIEGNLQVSAGDWKEEYPQGPLSGFWTAVSRQDGGNWKLINLTVNITPPPAK